MCGWKVSHIKLPTRYKLHRVEIPIESPCVFSVIPMLKV